MRTVAGILDVHPEDLTVEYPIGDVEIYEPDDLPLFQHQEPAETPT